MTIAEAAEKLNFKIVCEGSDASREIRSVYCCDLLSFAMSRAPEDCAWITVISNVNVIAVASLANTACVVIADGVVPDEQAVLKARENGIAVLCSGLPVFETAYAIYKGLEE